jgi:GntR family transcriptional regulator/MocR family aminotransferase
VDIRRRLRRRVPIRRAALPALKASDAGGRVIYAGTFAKSVLPSIRLGYVVCPPALTADFVLAKRLDDVACSAVEQVAMAGFVRSGGFETHLRKAVRELRRRREALLDGLARHCGKRLKLVDSQAGMHMIGWLPSFSPAAFGRLLGLALSRQLCLHPVAPHYMRQPPCPGLLLGFAALSVPQLAAASKVLGDCLREVCREFP